MKSSTFVPSLLALATTTMLAAAVSAADLHVGSGQPYAAIQSAIDAAAVGDHVIVHDGTYVENVVVNKQLVLSSLDYLEHGESDGVIINATSGIEPHGITITASGVTLEGFSIYNATGWGPGGDYRSGVFLDGVSNCLIRAQRCAWDDTHRNSVGITVRGGGNNEVTDNEVYRGVHGIRIKDSAGNQFVENWIRDVWTYSYSAGFYVTGSDQGGASTTQNNIFRHNTLSNNTVGMYLLTFVKNNTFEGNVIDHNVCGFLTRDSSNHNVFSGNTVTYNSGAGVWVTGAESNLITDNLLDNNGTGVRFGYVAPSDLAGRDCTVARNTITNNVTGILISPVSHGNRMYLNHFANNGENIHSEGTAWNTPSSVSYFYGANHGNFLGNYYASYTGTDTNGDGIGDTDLPFRDGDSTYGPSESYPLVESPTAFALQAWYLGGSLPMTMVRGGTSGVITEVAFPPGTAFIWASDEPAATDLAFAAGAWQGQMGFTSSVGAGAFLVEVGVSTNGTDFASSGAQAVVGSGVTVSFATSAAPLTVVAGRYLAVRITNLSGSNYGLWTGGAMTYASSPGLDDPRWPGETTGVPTAGSLGVSLAQNRPNPFNPQTVIAFEVPATDVVNLRVFDLGGRQVRMLLRDATLLAGPQQVVWDGQDDAGRYAPSGIYFYRLDTSARSVTRRMALLR